MRTKHQIPNAKLQRNPGIETPNTKLQTPEKLQAPTPKLEARAGVWSLELGISLVFGAWCLVFLAWDLELIWSLEFGALIGGRISPLPDPLPNSPSWGE